MLNKKSLIKQININEIAELATDMTELKNAIIVFQYALDSVNSFYKVYQMNRKGSKGSTTHEEQDLLRAMLVFACSGLDAVVKQLIKDSLNKVIEKDDQGKGARKEFQKFVERRIKRNDIADDGNKQFQIDTNYIAQVLTSPDPKIKLLSSLQKYLSDDSLQSRDQLLKAAAHFAITKDQLLTDADMTQKAFNIRNEIIHEMDVDLNEIAKGRKKRKMRSSSEMVGYANNIANVALNFINMVANKINGTP